MMSLIRGRRRADRSRASAGFSLIEVLVAILCLSIILVGFVSIFRGLVTIWLAGSSAIDMSQNVAVLTLKMSPEIRSALPPYIQHANFNMVGTDSSSASPIIASGNSFDDVIQFHVATRSSGEGTSTEYGAESQRRYFWLKRENARDFRIQQDNTISANTNPIPAIGTDIPANLPLAYSFRQFDVEYRDTRGVWSNSWNARTRKSLPDLVRVTIRTEKNQSYRDAVFIARPGATGTKITL